jgi:hypothetical protein
MLSQWKKLKKKKNNMSKMLPDNITKNEIQFWIPIIIIIISIAASYYSLSNRQALIENKLDNVI